MGVPFCDVGVIALRGVAVVTHTHKAATTSHNPPSHRAYTMPPIDFLKVNLEGPQYIPEYSALIMGKSW